MILQKTRLAARGMLRRGFCVSAPATEMFSTLEKAYAALTRTRQKPTNRPQEPGMPAYCTNGPGLLQKRKPMGSPCGPAPAVMQMLCGGKSSAVSHT